MKVIIMEIKIENQFYVKRDSNLVILVSLDATSQSLFYVKRDSNLDILGSLDATSQSLFYVKIFNQNSKIK